MVDIIDFAARKAELEGTNEECPTPETKDVRLMCNACGCMSFEIDGDHAVMCAACKAPIVMEGDANFVRYSLPVIGSIPLEPGSRKTFTTLENMTLDNFARVLRRHEDALVFVLAAFADGTVHYKCPADLSTDDDERIQWMYERLSTMLEAEGVDLGVPSDS